MLNFLGDLPAYVFGLLMLVIAVVGLFGISACIEYLVEIFLIPERYRPANLIRARREEQQAEDRRIRVQAVRERIKARPAPVNPNMSQAEIFASRSARIPITEEGLSAAISKAIERRGAYQSEDLTEEMTAACEARAVQQAESIRTSPVTRKRQVCQTVICRWPLSPQVQYLVGLSRGGQRVIWGSRRSAKIFLSDSQELKTYLEKAGFDGVSDVFVLKAHGSKEVLQPMRAKGATA